MAGGKTLERLQVLITADGSGLATGLNEAANKADRFGKKMRGVGKSLSRNVTAPIAAVGALSVKAFADFDQAMNQSVAIMGDVSDTMRNDMGDAAKDVARTTTTSASAAAEAYFFLASAGLDAEQSIAALPQVAAFAQAGMFDMSTATDLATDAQSALGLAADDAQENLQNLTRVTDVLVKANTIANAKVEQFATSLTTEAGAAMKTFNISMEEGVAVLAAFADQGIKGQVAGSGYARILRLMSSAAVNNKEELKALGVELLDSNDNMRNMADIVANLEVALGGMSDAQRTAALESIGFSARVQGVLLPLLGTSDAIREYEAGLRDAGGTTKEVAENQMKSFSASLSLVKNNLQLAGIEIGEVLAPTVAKLGELVVKVTDYIGEMNPTVLRWSVVAAGVTAAMGPLLIITGQLTIAVGALTAATGTLVGVMGTIATVVAPVVAAVGLVVGAFITVRNNLDKLKAFWQIAWFGIKQLAFDAVDGILGAVERLTSFIPVLGDKVAGIREQFQAFASDSLLKTALAVDDLRKKITGATDAIEEETAVIEEATAVALENAEAVREMAGAHTQAADSIVEAQARIQEAMSGTQVSSGLTREALIGDSEAIESEGGGAHIRTADMISASANRVLTAVQRVLQKLSGGSGFLGGITGALGGFLSGGPLGAGLGFAGGIGLFAEGGTINAGDIGIVGEAGPEIVSGPAQVTPMGDLTIRLDTSSMPPIPRGLSPQEAAIHSWYRQLFSEMVLDGKARGVLA